MWDKLQNNDTDNDVGELLSSTTARGKTSKMSSRTSGS